MEKQAHVPPTKVGKPDETKKQIRFDLSCLVGNYFKAKTILAELEQRRLEESVKFFEGLLVGYDDWFKVLGISQDIFSGVLSRLDRKKLTDEAIEVAKTIERAAKPLIVLPGSQTMQKLALGASLWQKR